MQTVLPNVVKKTVLHKPQLLTCLSSFDYLPDSSLVPLTIVCDIFGCSAATVWRRVRSGQLVAPYRIGSRTTRWQVGELRAELARIKAE